MIALEKYGGGASPAMEQTVAESIRTDFVEADLAMHAEEKDVLCGNWLSKWPPWLRSPQ